MKPCSTSHLSLSCITRTKSTGRLHPGWIPLDTVKNAGRTRLNGRAGELILSSERGVQGGWGGSGARARCLLE